MVISRWMAARILKWKCTVDDTNYETVVISKNSSNGILFDFRLGPKITFDWKWFVSVRMAARERLKFIKKQLLQFSFAWISIKTILKPYFRDCAATLEIVEAFWTPRKWGNGTFQDTSQYSSSERQSQGSNYQESRPHKRAYICLFPPLPF